MVIDKSNMKEVLEAFPRHCTEALSLAGGLMAPKDIANIVVCGMGGSAIGGDLLKTYMTDSDIPVVVNRSYKLPNFVDKDTLVFAVSYSGNTEETLEAVTEAKKRGAKIIAITSGGKLGSLADKVIKVPAGFQPRAAVGYLFFPMISVLYNSKLIDVKNSDLNEMVKLLQDKDYFENEGKRLAKLIKDRTPIIYSSDKFEPIAYRFKTQIQENAKSPAFNNVFPEMNHNEINAFQFMERSKFVVFIIRDEGDHPRIKKRFDICSDIMTDRVDVEFIETKGKSLLARMFSTLHLGDMVSYELAMNLRVDPTPVEVIEGLKKRLVE